MFTIRGAIIIEENNEKYILAGTQELLELIIKENDLEDEDITAIYFTATRDLDAAYPARSARELGIKKASLMCLQEMYVADSLERCIRVCFFCEGKRDQKKVRHIYTKGAEILRPDLN